MQSNNTRVLFGSAAVMPISSHIDPVVARGLLEFCIETGAAEPIGETTVDRFRLHMEQSASASTNSDARPAAESLLQSGQGQVGRADHSTESDPVQYAEQAAASSQNLDELHEAIAGYPFCGLREYARNLVFSDGQRGSQVMIVGEAPGGDEDKQGKPFVGASGRLLDRMFLAIDLKRDSEDLAHSLYITNVIPWRPPGNRNPTTQEVRMMTPFAMRHVELARPKLLVAIGNFSCMVFLGQTGVTRLRGKWLEWRGIPVMPTFHPAYLLRSPTKKSDSWKDMIMIRRRLNSL